MEYYSLLGKVSKKTNAFLLKKDNYNNCDSYNSNNSILDSFSKTNKNKLVFKPLSVSNSVKSLKNNNNKLFNKFSLKKNRIKFPLTKKEIINFLENDKNNINNNYYFSTNNTTYKKEILKDEIISNLMSKNLFKHKLNNNHLFKEKTKQMFGFRSFNKNYNNNNNNNKNKDNFFKSTITNSNKFYNF